MLNPGAALEMLAVDPLLRAETAIYDAAMLRALGRTPWAPHEPRHLHALVRQAIVLLDLKHQGGSPGKMILGAPSRNVAAAILGAARSTGASPIYLWRTAARESGFRPTAASDTSTGRGLYQFLDETWLATVARYGQRHGILAGEGLDPSARRRVEHGDLRKAILDLRYDPQLAARMAGELANENRRTMERALGRRVSEDDLYVAHFLGVGDALRLIGMAERSPDMIAAPLLASAARANPTIFYQRGRALSCRELLERLRHG